MCQKWKIVQFRFLFLFFLKINAKFGFAKLFYLFLPIFSLIHHLFFLRHLFSLPSIFILMSFFSHLDWTWLSSFADFLNIVLRIGISIGGLKVLIYLALLILNLGLLDNYITFLSFLKTFKPLCAVTYHDSKSFVHSLLLDIFQKGDIFLWN